MEPAVICQRKTSGEQPAASMTYIATGEREKNICITVRKDWPDNWSASRKGSDHTLELIVARGDLLVLPDVELRLRDARDGEGFLSRWPITSDAAF